jgi:primosomal protein N' (replication factor Y)
LQGGHPVLVQVPRGGYLATLACARDRAAARCPVCAGPLGARSERDPPVCRWCGRPAGDWRCPECGERPLRAGVVGSGRTAEELGRAFPGVPVRSSGGEHVVAAVPDEPAVVVATPGAEPVCADGYGAALLLDGWALLSRADLRAAEETLRRWANAAALVRPGGTVVVGADAAIPAVQALVRWDPAGAAARELAERAELGFPPVCRLASLTGAPAAITELVAAARLPEGAQVIGPVRVGAAGERLLVRVSRAHGAELARELKAAAAGRSARRAAESVRIQLDPHELI